ncbi:hypothetical protein MTES_1349 [Microbacterium testaceum StLB037]|uniref:CBM6 domain-containing protein n=1 Tax=Microbacterium testaceum (strain StLB037) TaxID=979556 RepID=E8N7Q7_MICTS|nr:carbohydrate-binding protein [Microbacterium testaceum]BAJ74313.1 hypothetical protein MTES_1349 [Microbacterium testaceum StLB037]
MRHPRWIAASAACAVLLGTFAAVAPPATAATTDTLSVDFATTTGDFRGGASGTLYGLGDAGAPTSALINGAHLTNTSQKAPFGTQHPSGDALKVENGFFAKNGTQLDIYVQDYYPDWPYNGGKRPGDDRTYNQADGTYTNQSNGIWDYLEVVEFVTEAVATKSAHPNDYVFIPFNEPDGGNWYADNTVFTQQFLPDWKAAVEKIRAVYARHGLGDPVIGGPGDASWRATRTATWLDYAKQTNTLPQFMIWHELGIDNLATYRSHYAEYRKLEADRGISPRQINITEYGLLRDMGVPGQLIQWFSMFEDTKVDAQTAYWNYAGNFSDNSARPNGANAGWWMFKWYGDLAGSKTVKVTPPQLNVADTLQGIGAIDATDKKATVLYGGSGADTVSLALNGLSSSVFGSRVDVEVREAPLSGAEGLAATPRVVASLSGVTVTNGGLQVSVPNYDRYAGYQVVVTPQRDAVATTVQPWSTSIEAEDTAITGATVYDQSPTGNGGWIFLASHGRDVGSFNNASAKADWTVDVPRDGTYRFQVIGATPGTPGRHALFVDGASAATVQYTADLALNNTSKWKYRGSAEVTVALKKGSHVLSLRASANGSAVLPNSDITLDKFVLTDVTDGERTVYPASTIRLAGAAALAYDVTGARGSARIGSDGRADVYATAFDSGYYDVRVDYRTTGASDVAVDLNGRRVATASASSAGTWSTTARLHLAEGINEIEVRSQSGILLSSVTTTRVTSADSAAIKVEAESGTRVGAVAVGTIADSTGTNASGGKYVGYLGNGAGNTLTIPRASGFNTAGDYDVVVKYTNAEVSGRHDYNPQVVDRRLQVSESGKGLVGEGYFRYTYSWNSFWEKTIPVTLTTSGGALVLGNDGPYAPDVDYVVIAPVRVGQPSTVKLG